MTETPIEQTPFDNIFNTIVGRDLVESMSDEGTFNFIYRRKKGTMNFAFEKAVQTLDLKEKLDTNTGISFEELKQVIEAMIQDENSH